jgi:hypothetical protein
MAPLPLMCPRCGRPQRVVPGGPRKHDSTDRPIRVVHTDTGLEECEQPPQAPPSPTAGAHSPTDPPAPA